jgi:hypothetical protein
VRASKQVRNKALFAIRGERDARNMSSLSQLPVLQTAPAHAAHTPLI